MPDRRSHMRFQVVGSLPGSLQANERLRLLNLGTTGALVEGAVPLPADAEYQMQLVLPSHVSDATVKIRRVTPVALGAGPARYHIGLEFLALTTEAEEAIARIVVATQGQG